MLEGSRAFSLPTVMFGPCSVHFGNLRGTFEEFAKCGIGILESGRMVTTAGIDKSILEGDRVFRLEVMLWPCILRKFGNDLTFVGACGICMSLRAEDTELYAENVGLIVLR
jgi:hypothetical protein